jgi:hypothetical protein
MDMNSDATKEGGIYSHILTDMGSRLFSVWGSDPRITVNKMRGIKSRQPDKIGELRFETLDNVFSTGKMKLVENAGGLSSQGTVLKKCSKEDRNALMDLSDQPQVGKVKFDFLELLETHDVLEDLIPTGMEVAGNQALDNPSDHWPVVAKILSWTDDRKTQKETMFQECTLQCARSFHDDL